MTERRLLIVDDERDFGEFVREVAEGAGYQVAVTTRGDEFMTAYETLNPTVIMLDMVMPGVDGIELVQWLAARRCPAKVIITTGFNPDYATWAGRLGNTKGLLSVTILAKPVRAADLRAALP